MGLVLVSDSDGAKGSDGVRGLVGVRGSDGVGAVL